MVSGLVDRQFQNVNVFDFAALGVTLFVAPGILAVNGCLVVDEIRPDVKFKRAIVAFEYRPVFDLVNFPHVRPQFGFGSECHGAACFAARDSISSLADVVHFEEDRRRGRLLIVHKRNVLVVFLLHRR